MTNPYQIEGPALISFSGGRPYVFVSSVLVHLDRQTH